MSRKQPQLQPFADRVAIAALKAQATTGDSPEEVVDAQRDRVEEALRSASPRLQRLADYKPDVDLEMADALRPVVLQLVNYVPYASDATDDSTLRWLFFFASWVKNVDRYFDPAEHLNESCFDAYIKSRLGDLTSASQGTARSALRRVRKAYVRAGATPAVKFQRKPVQPPYTVRERRSHYQAAADLAMPLQTEVLTMLDLSYHAGLAGADLNRARGDWIDEAGAHVVVTVPSTNGEFRKVPVFDAPAVRLRALTSSGLLLRPNVRKRENAVWALCAVAARQSDALEGFRAARARARWITDYLTMPIPFVAVARIAGINANARTFPDLLEELSAVRGLSDDQAIKYVQHGRGTMGASA